MLGERRQVTLRLPMELAARLEAQAQLARWSERSVSYHPLRAWWLDEHLTSLDDVGPLLDAAHRRRRLAAPVRPCSAERGDLGPLLEAARRAAEQRPNAHCDCALCIAWRVAWRSTT